VNHEFYNWLVISILLSIVVLSGSIFFRYLLLKTKNRSSNSKRFSQSIVNSVDESFEWMVKMVNFEVVAGWNIIIQYNIRKEGTWYIEIANGKCSLNKGRHKEPNLIIDTDVDTWMAIVNNKISGEEAYFTGKLKAEGDMEILMQYEEIFDRERLDMILNKDG